MGKVIGGLVMTLIGCAIVASVPSNSPIILIGIGVAAAGVVVVYKGAKSAL